MRPRRRRGLIPRLLLAWLVGTAPIPALGEVGEAELAAAYLYNFSKFVHWPSSVLGSGNEPLVLCVYGRNAASGAIEMLDGKSAQGHRIRIDRLSRGEALTACQIVYISTSESPYLAPLLRSLANRSILTVSEIPSFAAAGGMIGLVKQDNRLRFEINRASAEAAGLSISSQLLKLATRVVQR
ncbi:YfiR family protein [Thiorhodococcus mannitoliphagus]|uniref:YfiR family protein n=1 Tax=Thiorhodococcus mannitoliphagus TaxID=329406 RepID=A0A6P1DYN7_9GAMM|nr:YfiR family protein [Thiorhodococcus mannitoliphagus]